MNFEEEEQRIRQEPNWTLMIFVPIPTIILLHHSHAFTLQIKTTQIQKTPGTGTSHRLSSQTFILRVLGGEYSSTEVSQTSWKIGYQYAELWEQKDGEQNSGD